MDNMLEYWPAGWTIVRHASAGAASLADQPGYGSGAASLLFDFNSTYWSRGRPGGHRHVGGRYVACI